MHKRFHRGLLIALLFAPLLALTPLPTPVRAQSGGRLVLAFYYTWYSTDVWTGGKTADIAAQPYNSTDPAAIARHVDQARGAGIDAFVASWYGPDGGVNNQTQSNFLQLLDIANARGFHAAVDFETAGPFFGDAGAVVNALKYAIGTLGAHPAYLRYNGKPVIFFWANNRFSPDQWASIRAQADPNRNSIWIAEGVTTQWLSTFDGLHLYNVAWSSDFGATAAKFAKLSRDLGKVWVATAMPGWDDTRVPGRGGAYAKDRAGGQFYRNSFTGAAASNPDMLVITSFNEWMEGSQLEPSTSYGNLYLDLTRQFSAAYKQGASPPAPAALQATPVPPTVGATAEVATADGATADVATKDGATASAERAPTLTVTPAPTNTPLFDTPVAYVAARVLEPTATEQPSATPSPQPSPTMIVATLALERMTLGSSGEAAGAAEGSPITVLAIAAAGLAIVGGGAVTVGKVITRRGK